MTTYATMQSRIADELARTDLTTQIQAAIQSAIKHWERERFYFNETTGTFATVASQEYYTASDMADIPSIVEIVSARISLDDGSRKPLTARSFEEIDALSDDSSSVDDPTDLCVFAQKIRLYPIPSTVRTITLAYVKRFDALSADSDTNAWMTDAEELIRTWAKIDLFENIIRDLSGYEEANRLRGRIDGIADRLRGESRRRRSSRRLSASIP